MIQGLQLSSYIPYHRDIEHPYIWMMNHILQVQAIIRARTSAGQRHRDHANTGNVIKTDHQGALGKYFFGEKLDQKLSYKKFLQFHRDIQDEILWIEVSFSKLMIILIVMFNINYDMRR